MYQRKVQYYETDMMGVVHHSNYIRWMEEARTDYLQQIGCPYKQMEESGIISPTTSVECNYRKTSTYDDQITIETFIYECKGVKVKFRYRMTNQNGELVCEARSEHCFLDRNGAVISIKKSAPELYQLILNQIV